MTSPKEKSSYTRAREEVLPGRRHQASPVTFADLAADVRAVRLKAARRPPAGHYPVNVLFPWVTVAGCSLSCAGCGATGQAPNPRMVAEFNAACLEFLQKHRTCQEVKP